MNPNKSAQNVQGNSQGKTTEKQPSRSNEQQRANERDSTERREAPGKDGRSQK